MTIICGDCLEEMRKMEDDSISAIVTDPPYGLGFMGKHWDAGVPHDDIWKETLRICKAGAHLLAFGGTRTYHGLTCAIEDAGWEVRDCLMWVYGSGFPKSHNRFGIEGFGTALKPAYEPIILAMKPCDGTFAQNAEKWGQAGINIDGVRIGIPEDKRAAGTRKYKAGTLAGGLNGEGELQQASHDGKGRWPANVILDEESGKMLDEQSGISKSADSINHETKVSGELYGWAKSRKYMRSTGHTDSGGASRFFYCAKASSSERNAGLEWLPDVACQTGCGGAMPIDDEGNDRDRFKNICKNYHPTVKPLRLMEYLIKLVMPPKDGILLDPFAGSGTTILAAQHLGFNAIGIEKQPEYCEIARARLQSHQEEVSPQMDLFEVCS